MNEQTIVDTVIRLNLKLDTEPDPVKRQQYREVLRQTLERMADRPKAIDSTESSESVRTGAG